MSVYEILQPKEFVELYNIVKTAICLMQGICICTISTLKMLSKIVADDICN